MSVTVVVGEQRGDEGKGRFVDMLAQEHDIIARFNGGHNAGHTVILPDDRRLELHIIPSGIAYPDKKNVIGNGTLLHVPSFLEEKSSIEVQDFEVSPENLLISSAAHLILPHHIYDDVIREGGSGSQGTTKSGIAPAAAAKAMRENVRAEIVNNDPKKLYKTILAGLEKQRRRRNRAGLDRIDQKTVAEEYVEAALQIGAFVTDTTLFLNDRLDKRKPDRILAEAAQAFLLDPDHGMYPHTTSTSTISGGATIGLGIPPHKIDNVVGVAKAVQSHVGGGPFVTEITDESALARLHGDMEKGDAERGTTTGRIRRLGHLDIAQIRRAQMINGTREMALTKLDWVPRYGEVVRLCVAYVRKGNVLIKSPDAGYKLDQSEPAYVDLPTWEEDIQEVRNFEDLPENARAYVEFIEKVTKVPITMIGVGPKRDQVITR